MNNHAIRHTYCIPNFLVARDWIRCASHMNKMRKIDIVTIDVIQYLQCGVYHAKQMSLAQK